MFAGFLADALEGVGLGGDEVGDDFLGFGGELVETFDAGAVAAAFFRGFDGGFIRACCGFLGSAGGLGFSRRFSEKDLQLGGIDLFAFAAEEAAEEMVELGLKETVALFEGFDFEAFGFDFELLAGAFLFGRFDAF